MNKSILDVISDSISPVIRRLSDIQSNVSGTNTQVLRVYRVIKPYYKQRNNIQNQSILGDWQERLESEILYNVRINYPFNQVEYFNFRKVNESNILQGTITSPIHGIDFLENLPIIAEFMFEGEYESKPVLLNKGDKIIDIFYDENLNAVPIILEVFKILGDFFGKNIIGKKAQLSLFAGKLPEDMQNIVNEYVKKEIEEKKNFRNLRPI